MPNINWKEIIEKINSIIDYGKCADTFSSSMYGFLIVTKSPVESLDVVLEYGFKGLQWENVIYNFNMMVQEFTIRIHIPKNVYERNVFESLLKENDENLTYEDTFNLFYILTNNTCLKVTGAYHIPRSFITSIKDTIVEDTIVLDLGFEGVPISGDDIVQVAQTVIDRINKDTVFN